MFGKFGASSASTLDPFAFWPRAKSRIGGLGGNGDTPEPDAVFHTTYHSFDTGPLSIDFVFAKLVAAHGKMQIQALALSDGSATHSVQTTTVVDLAELAANGGRFRLPVIVKADHAYAFVGRILDNDTDACAASLTLRADQHGDGPVFARRLAAAKKLFGQRRGSAGIVVEEPATLETVRSQMCTAAQFAEPDYDRWIAAMHRPKHQHRKQWEHVWICRVLETMGALQNNARGLGFGCGIEPLPAVFARQGIEVLATDLGAEDRRAQRWQATDQHLLDLEALSDPSICPPDIFYHKVNVAAIDMNAVPPDLIDYDFCWSSCSLEHLGTIDSGLRFIERSLDTLKPGGVAVHTTELNLTSNSRTIKKGGTVLFRRSDIEGFARHINDSGHEVLPITWDQGDQPEDQIVDVAPYAADIHFKLALRGYVTTSFGLAIRKKK